MMNFNSSDSLTTDSVLDTLTPHSVPVVVGLDWERDGWRVSIAGKPAVRVSREALLTETFPTADIVVVEQAHLRERNVYSVSQVYTAEQLRQLAFRSKVRLFPGKLVWRASEFAGNLKLDGAPDKERDAESIAVYAAAHPAQLASWKAYKLPDEDPARRLWEARDALRTDLQEALNPLRAAWNGMNTAQKYNLPEVADFCALLNEHFNALTPGIKEQYGIRRSRNGIRVERMAAALTVYLAVFTRDGELRRNNVGGFIGVRFILDAIGLSHSHKPNMARSQLTWHGMRHYKGGREGGGRCEYMRNLRHFLAMLRDAGDSLTVDSVPDTRTNHSVPGANFGSDSLTKDSVLDTLTLHSVPAVELQEVV